MCRFISAEKAPHPGLDAVPLPGRQPARATTTGPNGRRAAGHSAARGLLERINRSTPPIVASPARGAYTPSCASARAFGSGCERVERLMAQAQIFGLVRRKRGRTTIRVPGSRRGSKRRVRRRCPIGQSQPDFVRDVRRLQPRCSRAVLVHANRCSRSSRRPYETWIPNSGSLDMPAPKSRLGRSSPAAPMHARGSGTARAQAAFAACPSGAPRAARGRA